MEIRGTDVDQQQRTPARGWRWGIPFLLLGSATGWSVGKALDDPWWFVAAVLLAWLATLWVRRGRRQGQLDSRGRAS
ncbi:hypothetical protein ACFP3Q_02825 [Nocardioides sp. GCM10027113]|uniref:hypothetical protein n=1 Tax=unclassified Nocardioides TaxID=2615069 RepID=UPI0036143623